MILIFIVEWSAAVGSVENFVEEWPRPRRKITGIRSRVSVRSEQGSGDNCGVLSTGTCVRK